MRFDGRCSRTQEFPYTEVKVSGMKLSMAHKAGRRDEHTEANDILSILVGFWVNPFPNSLIVEVLRN